MAQRRMFSKTIVETDAFLDMSTGAQLLYFHLNMEADDDGFVSSPKKIMRNIGAKDDDYKLLLIKRFVLPFQSGVCVIKHWLIHNYIRKDTYNETQYIDEKNLLEIKENGSYTERQRSVDGSSTQDRLGKDRLELGKVRIDKNIYGEHKNVKLYEEEYSKLSEALGENQTLLLIEELSSYMASKGKKYASHYATIQTWSRMKAQKQSDKKTSNSKPLYVA
jgi:hypothetical protein